MKYSYLWHIPKKRSVADLVKCTVQMHSAASAYKCDTDILKKIDSVTYDSAAHNLKVTEKICETNLL